MLDSRLIHVDTEPVGGGSGSDGAQQQLCPSAADVEHCSVKVLSHESDELVGALLR